MTAKKSHESKALKRGVEELAELLRTTRGRRHGKELILRDQLSHVAADEVVVLVAGKSFSVAHTLRLSHPALMRDLELGLEGAKFAVEQISTRREQEVGSLTDEEATLLADGGLHEADPARKSASDVAAIEYGTLLKESLSVEEAARVLNVNESRVRQRLAARALFGIKDGRNWRLPRFQFGKGRTTPGLEKVLPALPDGMHPVAVHRWLKTPHPDLETEDEDALAPLEWLASGRAAARVCELAALL